MITSLSTSLMRVTLFWYLAGCLVLFLGNPVWAEDLYTRLMRYPWVPELDMEGISTAASVQWRLLVYWTVPMAILWFVSLTSGVLIAEVQCQLALRGQRKNLQPVGKFWGVFVPKYSLGKLPRPTTPALKGQTVSLGGAPQGKKTDSAMVELQGAMKEAVKLLTPTERQLAEELLQLLLQQPDHFAGLGHGVGLLEHTLNVVTEAASKVTPEFRLPFLAALSHDIGKLITFQPDGKGGWKRRGLHSRESARILATLPGFQELPEMHQRALLLAVKYDHAPNKMPELRGEREACTLAMRTISALSQADRRATAGEKERHLERLQPEDLLWKDFVDFLREAPVVQRGKKGVANQVNNPPDSPYLFLYEAPWRDAAVRRLPAEVAAALDLTRRDSGKMAKYTRILVERLRKEGVLVDSYVSKDKEGNVTELAVSDSNPLWDIQSGTGEKAVVLRGILVLKADELWKKLNYRISIKSPFPVQILAPNADSDGRVNDAPRANRDEPRTPDVSDGLKLADVESTDAMAALGLTAEPTEDVKAAKPKTRARGGFKSAPVASPVDDAMFGLKDAGAPLEKVVSKVTSEVPSPAQPEGALSDEDAQALAELEAVMGNQEQEPDTVAAAVEHSDALDGALAFITSTAVTEAPEAADESINEGVEIVEDSQAEATSEEVLVADKNPGKVEQPTKQADKPAAKPAAKEAPAPKQEKSSATATPTAPTTVSETAELSRAEKREGLAIADATAVEKYPGLKVGDKYYTELSRAVAAGLKKPGSRYKGDSKDKQLDLTEGGPRRGRRRLTS